jgi:hypothetical protein
MKTGVLAPTYRPIAHNVKLYDGPSQLTGDRIFVIATAANSNRKIGPMLQLWILPAESPIEAVRSGRDAAVCGDCQLRGDGHGKERVCYVEWWRSVSNIWQGHPKAERVDEVQFARLAAGLQLRIGAYGDPAAVPMRVWTPMLASAAGWTAYTHQWRRLGDEFRRWCMASVDSEDEARHARALGWRTFRVRGIGSILDGAAEVICPHEFDNEIKCASCSLCRGAARPAKSVVVTVHGRAGVKWFGRRPVDEPVAKLVGAGLRSDR